MPFQRLITALLASLFAVADLRAQSDSISTAGCTYDACALRQEGNVIRRGLAGDRVAKMGFFSATELSSFVRGDSANLFASSFNKEYRKGMRLVWLGLVATEVPLLIAYDRSQRGHSFDATHGALVGTAVGGLVINQLGWRSLKRARSAVSKAIWWHNRGLSR
jgi:hypothetical protein